MLSCNCDHHQRTGTFLRAIHGTSEGRGPILPAGKATSSSMNHLRIHAPTYPPAHGAMLLSATRTSSRVTIFHGGVQSQPLAG
ncbi:hypothetical protein FKM82_002083 [Ascaphus truei]